MKDLEWIKADIIQINHDVMANLSDKMLGFYANTLNSIIEFHKQNNGKEICVIFSAKQKKLLWRTMIVL